MRPAFAGMMIGPELTLAALVLDHPECARVLQKHRIDFCCQGERPISRACDERGVDSGELITELERAIGREIADVDLRSLSTAALVEHIVDRHHGYLREALPFVGSLATKVARVHGGHNPRLLELKALIDELREVLEPHLDHEETHLFPAWLLGTSSETALREELDAMVTEHEAVGALLARVRAATEDYHVPDWGCRSYRTLFAELETLEGDVLRHVHTENYVLKPRLRQSLGLA